MQELTDALNAMASSKTPGSDGLTVEFYRAFWEHLKLPYYEAIISSLEKDEELYVSARTGILNLIPKPNKDSRYIKNLRPITLLNVDYKIVEKVIATRMLGIP